MNLLTFEKDGPTLRITIADACGLFTGFIGVVAGAFSNFSRFFLKDGCSCGFWWTCLVISSCTGMGAVGGGCDGRGGGSAVKRWQKELVINEATQLAIFNYLNV